MSVLSMLGSVVRYADQTTKTVLPIIQTASTIKSLFAKPTPIPAVAYPPSQPPPQPPQGDVVAPSAQQYANNSGGNFQANPNLSTFGSISPMMMGLGGLVAVLVVVLLIKK